MGKTTIETIKTDRFTIKNIFDMLTEIVGADKEIETAFIVIKTKERPIVVPMGDALKQIELLQSGMIEKSVKEIMELVKAEIVKRFLKATKEEKEERKVN